MAHAIDDTTGQAAVFVTGEPAWHKLGRTIEKAASSAEAIGLAGLDWRVEQWPVRAFDPDQPATEVAIPDTVANVRATSHQTLTDLPHQNLARSGSVSVLFCLEGFRAQVA